MLSRTPPDLDYTDHFAFQLESSIMAALIYLLHNITTMLETNPYVIVIAADFLKAFDSKRHPTMLQKYASRERRGWDIGQSTLQPSITSSGLRTTVYSRKYQWTTATHFSYYSQLCISSSTILVAGLITMFCLSQHQSIALTRLLL